MDKEPPPANKKDFPMNMVDETSHESMRETSHETIREATHETSREATHETSQHAGLHR